MNTAPWTLTYSSSIEPYEFLTLTKVNGLILYN